jgi:hypothetical protein
VARVGMVSGKLKAWRNGKFFYEKNANDFFDNNHWNERLW